MFYKEDRFTEEEKLAIEGLALLIAELCNIDYADLVSRSRKRELVDARKLLCMYAYNNIPVASSKMRKSLSLLSWFLNFDHSTIIHSIDSGNNLYETDAKFKALYNTIISIIDNPDYDAESILNDVNEKVNKMNWSFVRKDVREKLYIRYLLMPENIKMDVRDLFHRGFTEFTIAEKADTTLDLINYFIKKEKLVVNKTNNINRLMSLKKYKPRLSKAIEY